MFAILYEFEVKLENETAFTKLWHTLTLRIKELSTSSGSRLHKLNDTIWVAYALWPSKEDWEKSDLNQDDMVEMRNLLIGLCDDIKIVYQLDVFDDLISY